MRQNDPIETDMSATEAPPLILIWLRHLNHSLQRYDWDAKLSVDTNITDTPRPDLAPIWLRHPISNEYIYDCDAFYLWHTYDWDTPTRSCTHMTATPKIFFMIYILTQIWLRRSKISFFDSTFDTIMTATPSDYFITLPTWHKYDCDGLNFCFLIQHLTQLWLRQPQIILKLENLFSTWNRYDLGNFFLSGTFLKLVFRSPILINFQTVWLKLKLIRLLNTLRCPFFGFASLASLVATFAISSQFWIYCYHLLI